MPGLPGLSNHADFPMTVRESLTILPFRAGGETLITATNVDEILVLVSALRRFENDTNVATGAHTGGANAAVLTDSAGNFLNKGIAPGDLINNDTDGSSTTITAVTATTVTGILAGGTDDDWDNGDLYSIDKVTEHAAGRATLIRRLRITADLDIYVRYDGDASAGQHSIRIDAGEAINEDGFRIISGISFINAVADETPTVRWSVAGF